MKKRAKQKAFKIKEGTIIKKNYYGKEIILYVVKAGNEINYKIENLLFTSLTAAARHVIGDPTRQISGPIFWNVKTKK